MSVSLNKKNFSIIDLIFKLLPWIIIGVQSYIFNDELKKSFARISTLENDFNRLLENNIITIDIMQKASNSNMTQFYIKVIGITAVAIVLLTITSNIYPTLFTAKALLPSYVYNLVQTYTPFLQTKKVFTLKDCECNVDWIVNIYNEKTIEIMVRPFTTQKIVKASEYFLNIPNSLSERVVKSLPIYPPDQTALAFVDFLANTTL